MTPDERPYSNSPADEAGRAVSDLGVTILRCGHRPGRDDRMTTHVGLTARALGADRVVFPENAGEAVETVRNVTTRFGGPFAVERRGDQRRFARNWNGAVVHLTMYGEPIQDTLDEIRSQGRGENAALLVIVGGGKVPFDFYETADWNVAVTNQPHSEVAALAVFLDRLFDGLELDREWENAEKRVVPRATGKQVIELDPDEDE